MSRIGNDRPARSKMSHSRSAKTGRQQASSASAVKTGHRLATTGHKSLSTNENRPTNFVQHRDAVIKSVTRTTFMLRSVTYVGQ
ncbi:hypothetical protein U1Q18_037106 [Sarracenia purpurea var. burkii]